MQTSLSLFSNKRGFIGRTYTGIDVPLGSKPDGRNYLLPDTDSKMMQDAALFYSKYADDDIQAVIEFIFIVREADPAKKQEQKKEESKDGPIMLNTNSSKEMLPSASAGSLVSTNKAKFHVPKVVLKRFGIGWSVIKLFG